MMMVKAKFLMFSFNHRHARRRSAAQKLSTPSLWNYEFYATAERLAETHVTR
jgi:hypothetical protein